jgi:two-component system LytT family response regulator
MRVLVVDDEPLARVRLLRMLEKIQTIESVAEAENGRRALEQTKLFNPNVILLDIRMPGISGLDVARSTSPEVAIIFTTAYDEHAIEAFEIAAIDYLLKPIRQERLEQALERAHSSVGVNSEEDVSERYDRFQASQGGEANPRITARKGDSIRVFDPSEVDRLTSKGGYTSFHHRDEEFLLDESLSTLEIRLKPSGFVRVHRSEIIRIGAVRAIHTDGGGTTVELADGDRAPVSRRLLAELKNALGIF